MLMWSLSSPSSSAPTTTAAPAPSSSSAPTGTGSSAPSSTATPAAGNPFEGYTVFRSPFYAAEVQAAAAQISDASLKAAALQVADVPSFTWFDQVAKVPQLGEYLGNASAQQASSGEKVLVPIVVYDLPDRDCAAKASNGEFSIADGGAEKYQGYIDDLVEQIQSRSRPYPSFPVTYSTLSVP